MEATGIRIDTAYLGELSQELAATLERLEREAIEAAAAGLPIVMSAAAGNIREVVEAPNAGFVIRDPAEPSEALRSVLSASDTELAAMGVRAAQIARTQFDAVAVARSLVKQLYPS